MIKSVFNLIKEHFLNQADSARPHWGQKWDYKMPAMLEAIEGVISCLHSIKGTTSKIRTHLEEEQASEWDQCSQTENNKGFSSRRQDCHQWWKVMLVDLINRLTSNHDSNLQQAVPQHFTTSFTTISLIHPLTLPRNDGEKLWFEAHQALYHYGDWWMHPNVWDRIPSGGCYYPQCPSQVLISQHERFLHHWDRPADQVESYCGWPWSHTLPSCWSHSSPSCRWGSTPAQLLACPKAQPHHQLSMIPLYPQWQQISVLLLWHCHCQ